MDQWAQPLLGLTIYLYCGLWVSYKGDPMLGSPGTLLFPQTLLFTSQNHYLSFLEWLLSSLPILSGIANPHSLFSSPIYKLG